MREVSIPDLTPLTIDEEQWRETVRGLKCHAADISLYGMSPSSIFDAVISDIKERFGFGLCARRKKEGTEISSIKALLSASGGEDKYYLMIDAVASALTGNVNISLTMWSTGDRGADLMEELESRLVALFHMDAPTQGFREGVSITAPSEREENRDVEPLQETPPAIEMDEELQELLKPVEEGDENTARKLKALQDRWITEMSGSKKKVKKIKRSEAV